MSRLVTTVFVLAAMTAPAFAPPPPLAVPAPEVTGGIIGMVFAAGVAYLLTRRSRT